MYSFPNGPPNNAEDVQVYGNTLLQSNYNCTALQTYNYATNIYFHDNDFSSFVTNSSVYFSSTLNNPQYGGQCALVDINNNYLSPLYDLVGVTKYVNYGSGSRFEVVNGFHAGTVYALTDTNASQIPAGAQIIVYNNNTSGSNVPVYLNSALTGVPIIVASGQTFVASWTNGAWVNYSGATNSPPANPAIQVSAASLPFGIS